MILLSENNNKSSHSVLIRLQNSWILNVVGSHAIGTYDFTSDLVSNCNITLNILFDSLQTLAPMMHGLIKLKSYRKNLSILLKYLTIVRLPWYFYYFFSILFIYFAMAFVVSFVGVAEYSFVCLAYRPLLRLACWKKVSVQFRMRVQVSCTKNIF